MRSARCDDLGIFYQFIQVKFYLSYNSFHIPQAGKLLLIKKITFVKIVVVNMSCI